MTLIQALAAGAIVLTGASTYTNRHDMKPTPVGVGVHHSTSHWTEECQQFEALASGFGPAAADHSATIDVVFSAGAGPRSRVCSAVVPGFQGAHVSLLVAGYPAEGLEAVPQLFCESAGARVGVYRQMQSSHLEDPRGDARSDAPPWVIASITAVILWLGLLGLCAYLVAVTGDPRVLRYLAEVVAAARSGPAGMPADHPPSNPDSTPEA